MVDLVNLTRCEKISRKLDKPKLRYRIQLEKKTKYHC